MSHKHVRMQYATAPAIAVERVERFDGEEQTPFDAEGWELFFRMWRYVVPGRCGDATVVVDDQPAIQPAVGELAYMPTADDVATAGSYRGVFWARRESDGARDIWPVQEIEITAVLGGVPPEADS